MLLSDMSDSFLLFLCGGLSAVAASSLLLILLVLPLLLMSPSLS
jgi:hypothetical protein